MRFLFAGAPTGNGSNKNIHNTKENFSPKICFLSAELLPRHRGCYLCLRLVRIRLGLFFSIFFDSFIYRFTTILQGVSKSIAVSIEQNPSFVFLHIFSLDAVFSC